MNHSKERRRAARATGNFGHQPDPAQHPRTPSLAENREGREHDTKGHAKADVREMENVDRGQTPRPPQFDAPADRVEQPGDARGTTPGKVWDRERGAMSDHHRGDVNATIGNDTDRERGGR